MRNIPVQWLARSFSLLLLCGKDLGSKRDIRDKEINFRKKCTVCIYDVLKSFDVNLARNRCIFDNFGFIMQ